MARPNCHAECPESAKACGACGARLAEPKGDTTQVSDVMVMQVHEPQLSKPAVSDLDSGSVFATSHGLFAPGALILDRYRIITKLGAGAMGEVYRADDCCRWGNHR